MRIKNYISLTRKFNGTGLFYASGSFGILDGNLPYAVEETANGRVYTYSNETVTLRAEFRQEGDVTVRRDSLRNLTGETMELNAFVNRFTLDGDAYEVYTQFNGWVHENKGLWQKLVTRSPQPARASVPVTAPPLSWAFTTAIPEKIRYSI